MKTGIYLTSALALLLSTGNVLAKDELKGFYAGGTYNRLSALAIKNNSSNPKADKVSKGRWGFGLTGGYYFNQYFAVELDAIKYGSENAVSCDDKEQTNQCIAWSQDYSQYSVGVLGRIPLRNYIEAFAKVSYTSVKYSNSWESHTSNTPLVEAGFIFTRYDNISLVGSGSKFKIHVGNGRETTSSGFSLKAIYHF